MKRRCQFRRAVAAVDIQEVPSEDQQILDLAGQRSYGNRVQVRGDIDAVRFQECLLRKAACRLGCVSLE